MRDIATYFMTFGAEFAAALPRKVHDPVAWGLLVGALLIGAAAMRRRWVFALGTFLLIFAALLLESVYLSSSVSRGDRAALAIIYLTGIMAGHGLGSLWSRRSTQRP
jgi:peptidoglycan/LPS O-acetylase OafA/YrhL